MTTIIDPRVVALILPYAKLTCAKRRFAKGWGEPAEPIDGIFQEGSYTCNYCGGTGFNKRFDPFRGDSHEIATTWISINKDDPKWGDLEVSYCVHCGANDLDGEVPELCLRVDVSSIIDVFMECGFELLFMNDKGADLPGPPFRVHWRGPGMSYWLGARTGDTKIVALSLAFAAAIPLRKESDES